MGVDVREGEWRPSCDVCGVEQSLEDWGRNRHVARTIGEPPYRSTYYCNQPGGCGKKHWVCLDCTEKVLELREVTNPNVTKLGPIRVWRLAVCPKVAKALAAIEESSRAGVDFATLEHRMLGGTPPATVRSMYYIDRSAQDLVLRRRGHV